MSSKRKKDADKPKIEDNSNFVRTVVYAIVGVLGVFVIGIYVYNYMNPKSDEEEEPDSNGVVEKQESPSDTILAQLALLRGQEGSIPQDKKDDLEAHFRQRIALLDQWIQIADTDELKTQGYGEKLQLLVKLNSIGAESAQQELKTFVASLDDVGIEDVKFGGRVAYLTVLLNQQIYETKDPDFQPFFDQVESDMTDYQNSVPYANMVMRFIQQMVQAQRSDEVVKFMEMLLPYYRESKNTTLQNQVIMLEGLIGMEKSKITISLGNLVRGTDDSEQQFVESFQKMIDDNSINAFSFTEIVTALGQLEKSNRYESARKLYGVLGEKLGSHTDAEIADAAKRVSEKALKRLAMLNQRFEPDGFDFEGKPFDVGQFKGQITVLFFFAFHNQKSMQFFDELIRKYAEIQNPDFKIAGCMIDDKPWRAIRVLKANMPYWSKFPIVVTSPDQDSPANDLIEKIGIQTVPYGITIDADGIIRDIDVILGTLPKSVQDVREGKFGDSSAADKDTDKKAGKKKADEKKSDDKKADDGTTKDKNPNSVSARDPAFVSSSWLTSTNLHVVADTHHSIPGYRVKSTPAKPTTKQDVEQDAEQDQQDETENPYLAPPHWSKSDLVDFILKMEEKPRSIRRRPAFALAIADAADRVLADKSAKKTEIRVASLGKTEILHEHGCLGDEQMDKKLWEFIGNIKDPQDKRVAAEVAFLRLEQELIAAADAESTDGIEELLTTAKKFFVEQISLTGRHLRLASTSIELVNRLESEDEKKELELTAKRDELYKEFGKLFAGSEDKRMAKYGKYLTKATGSASAWVGKPLELAGPTVNGTEFDWKSYRQKIVVVDFWATWCGPCRKEMPNVKAIFEELNDQGFEVVGVALDDDEQAVADYVTENDIAWENLVGPKAKELAQQYGVKGIPTMMLIDREGKVLAVANRIGQLKAEIQKQFK